MGCRRRAAKSDLLRVVVRREGTGTTVVPDPRGRLPGRGAYVHHDPSCIDLAERRLPRALRVPGPLSVGEIRRYVEQQTTSDGRSKCDELSMSRQSTTMQ